MMPGMAMNLRQAAVEASFICRCQLQLMLELCGNNCPGRQ